MDHLTAVYGPFLTKPGTWEEFNAGQLIWEAQAACTDPDCSANFPVRSAPTSAAAHGAAFEDAAQHELAQAAA